MVDQIKRRTLKLMTATGSVAAAASLGGITGSAIAATSPDNSRSPDLNAQPFHLKVRIITGGAVPEDTVIFTNDTNDTIEIEEFLPGFVTLGNRMMDLNTLTRSDSIVVKPGYPVASKLARWEVLALEENNSYLWCDTAVDPLHESDNRSANFNATGIITIDAAVVNHRAMLTLKHPFSYPVFS